MKVAHYLRQQAERELAQELAERRYREAVEAEKERLRNKPPSLFKRIKLFLKGFTHGRK